MTIKLDHINLTVSNLTESTEWYRRIFGFEIVESGTTPQGIRWAIVAFNDSMICMAEYRDRSFADRRSDESIHQIYHFGIRVSDKEKWQQIVKENQLKVSYGGVIDYPFSNSWYIHDPTGHEIEVSYTSNETLQFPRRGA